MVQQTNLCDLVSLDWRTIRWFSGLLHWNLAQKLGLKTNRPAIFCPFILFAYAYLLESHKGSQEKAKEEKNISEGRLPSNEREDPFHTTYYHRPLLLLLLVACDTTRVLLLYDSLRAYAFRWLISIEKVERINNRNFPAPLPHSICDFVSFFSGPKRILHKSSLQQLIQLFLALFLLPFQFRRQISLFLLILFPNFCRQCKEQHKICHRFSDSERTGTLPLPKK